MTWCWRRRAHGGGEIVPVDSEHSAVLQCITGRAAPVSRLILTASGGPFREWTAGADGQATVEEALRHPTWQMGRKITVDSATLANKALEMIEAHLPVRLPYDALGRRWSIPRASCTPSWSTCDGSVMAQLGFPSMELPILYALTYPDAAAGRRRPPLRSARRRSAHVRAGPEDVFGAFRAGVAAGRAGGTAPAVFNAANEEAVAAFLDKRIGFGRISELLDDALLAHDVHSVADVETVRAADCWARRRVRENLA